MTPQERLSTRLKACGVQGDTDAQAAELLAQGTGQVPKDWLDHLMKVVAPMMAPPPQEPSQPAKPAFDLAYAEQKLAGHYVNLGFGNDSLRLAQIRMNQRNARLTPLKTQFDLARGEDVATVKMHLGKQVKG